MSITVVALIIACALCWSLYDVSRKYVTKDIAPGPALLIFCLFQIPCYWIWIKLGSSSEVDLQNYIVPGLAALAVNFAANFLFFKAIQISDISKSVPMLSFTPVFAFVSSWIVLGEVPTATQFGGASLVSLGALILNGKPSLTNKGPYLMLVVALLWGSLGPVDKLCVRYTSIPMHIMLQTIGIALLLLVLFIFNPPKTKTSYSLIKKHKLALLIGAPAAVGALGLQLLLMRQMYVGIVEASKRGVLLFFTILFGKILFDESINRRKIIAIVVIGIGLFFVF